MSRFEKIVCNYIQYLLEDCNISTFGNDIIYTENLHKYINRYYLSIKNKVLTVDRHQYNEIQQIFDIEDDRLDQILKLWGKMNKYKISEVSTSDKFLLCFNFNPDNIIS